MEKRVKLVIVDDHPLFRQGVSLALNKFVDIEVVAEADRVEAVFHLVKNHQPDLILMDISMPGMGGLEGLRLLSHEYPDVKVMMLTVSENGEDLMKAIQLGAKGYLLKGVTAQQLAEAIRMVAAGDVYITPSLASGILFEMTYGEEAEADSLKKLNERERQILTFVAQGLTNRAIGEKLFLAEKTVKHYLTSVFQKLQVKSRVEAALLARGHDLGDDSPD